MGDCPSREMISRYLDGELDPAEYARFEAHLASCARCRQAADKLVQAGDFLRLAAAADFPPPARLDRMIGERFFSPTPEASLGVIDFDLSKLDKPSADRTGPDLALAAERPADYVPGPEMVGPRGCRRSLSGEGIEVLVELFRGAPGAAGCRVAVRDRTGKPLDGVRLQLEKEGVTVWSSLTRREEESVIPRLFPGRYRLQIEHDRPCVLILELR